MPLPAFDHRTDTWQLVSAFISGGQLMQPARDLNHIALVVTMGSESHAELPRHVQHCREAAAPIIGIFKQYSHAAPSRKGSGSGGRWR